MSKDLFKDVPWNLHAPLGDRRTLHGLSCSGLRWDGAGNTTRNRIAYTDNEVWQ